MATENNINNVAQLSSQLSNLTDILSTITDMMPDRHFVVDENGAILTRFGNVLSEQFYELGQHRPASVAELTSPENTQKTLTAIKEALATQQIVSFEATSKLSDVKTLMPNVDGPDSQQWFEVRVSKLGFLIDDKQLLIVSVRNITERKLAEIKLNELAITDSLTQLYNRRYAKEELIRCLQRFSRYQTDVSLLMLDIDFFKSINDNYGHDVGDIVLVELSQLLKNKLRSVDTIARVGGEEFLIIMPDSTVETMTPFFERLLISIEQLKIATTQGQISITVSGGLSQFVTSDKSIETILKRTDIALYNAKSAGRNRIIVG